MDLFEQRKRHPEHAKAATAIRVLTLDAVARAKSGHSGMPIGMADVATVLWTRHLRFDAAAPDWFDRDRFVLSAGHGSMLIYALGHLAGFADMPMSEIENFRQWGSRTAGHPEYGHAPGVDTTTGPLGQGLANAVGMAMAEEHMRARFGKAVCDHHTYVIAGDGCLMEGVSHEAIDLAGHQKLSRLVLFWDDNNITIDGEVGMASSMDQQARFTAAGWHVQSIDGHDPEAIDAAIQAAKADPRPSMIACKTHIAIGTAAQDSARGHGAITDGDEIAEAKKFYEWDAAPFTIPEDVLSFWRNAGQRGAQPHAEWKERVAALSERKNAEFNAAIAGELPKRLSTQIRSLKRQLAESQPSVASRKASQNALDVINPVMRETIGGSADLTGSNNTKSGDMTAFGPDNRKGRYVYYGVREHGMAAVMNGMALHGGVRPYGGTFMVFSDYARPAMRMAALMATNTVFVMTHDSIGVGEDGPTHQPVEHLASLRAMPNMLVLRPADATETAEAWEVALSQTSRPTTLALTRQNLPALRTSYKTQNMVERGGYVLAEAEGGRRQAILMASGSEVSVAMAARALLQKDGIPTRVVSMPSFELLAEQDEAWRRKLLPAGPVRVGVEAGMRQGWDRWLLGERGREAKADFVGMTGFGASAPAGELFEQFGITAEAVAAKAKALL